ncbi:MAG: class II fructose-bisphosphate aldolase [Anaerolineales bacterium]
MLISTLDLLGAAEAGGYALGAFNVYNLEGARAVLAAAEAERSPVMLQLHPSALRQGGLPLVALCRAAAEQASVPAAVHLDHSSSMEDIRTVLAAGVTSIMADGSHLSYSETLAFTREVSPLVHAQHGVVEGELGRLTGTEDDATVAEHEARLTDPHQAVEFAANTGVDALAVCIGNVHGHYRTEPRLEFARLAAIRDAVSVPLVLHGASGLPETTVRRAIELGVRKFNVNTEVRQAYLLALHEIIHSDKMPDLLDVMDRVVTAMQAVVTVKLRLFGSAGRA